MTLVCPHCAKAIDYSGEQPRFCGFCGQSLSGAVAATTAAYPAAVDAAHAETLAPHEAPPPNVVPAVPERVGGYRLLRTLGSGGMGTVYEAEDPSLGRRVALKLISPQFAKSRDTIERFRQEGRLASAIAHPRCVFVVAAEEDAGRPYIVMELMPGSTLDDLVRREGPLPPEQAVLRILDVIEGLQEAHRLGVIHRDVKPNNCFVEDDGRVKIGDFGLSKSLVSDHQLTKTGSFLGTPLYSSPEQIRGEQVDEQTDVYSVAATLYFLLTGKAPFQSGDAMASLARIAADDAPPMRTVRPELPAGLDRIVLRGLERDRRKRWQNLGEFAEALRNFLPRQLSIGGLGIRAAAYFLDSLLGAAVVVPLGFLFSAMLGKDEFTDAYAQVELYATRIVLGLTFWTLYFGVPESLWGCSLGKWLLGLRVRQLSSADPPGLLRSLARALTVTVAGELYGAFAILTLALTVTPGTSWEQVFAQQPLIWLATTTTGLMQIIVPTLLLCWPMRAENGYRGLHDFLFGTLVVAAPTRRRQAAFPTVDLHERLRKDVPEPVPDQVGPFVIEGTLRRTEHEQWLLAREPTLNRSVWLWLRPSAEPPLPGVRREIGRITRPRWLAGGEHNGWRWDAFIATPGVPMSELARHGKRYAWADARPVIEQLTEELVTATDEGTFPARPDLEHVLLQQAGRVVLVDSPVLRQPDNAVGGPAARSSVPQFMPAVAGCEEHGLRLLRDVSNVLLEGRAENEAGARAPVPGHARGMLDRLTGVASPYRALREFELDLVATRGLPMEVTRSRRTAHLALLCAFTLFPLFMMIFGAFMGCFMSVMLVLFETERRVDTPKRFKHVPPADVATIVNPDPWVRLQGAMQLERDLGLQKSLDDRIERDRKLREAAGRASRLNLEFATFIMEANRAQPGFSRALQPWSSDYRLEAEQTAFDVVSNDLDDEVLGFLAVWVLFWPLVWIVWAFLFRGGLSFRFTGLMLVRRDGRRAARWQCAWRAALTWLPVAGLLILSFILSWQFFATADLRLLGRDGPDYYLAYLSTACLWGGVTLPVVYLLLALWQPTRALHDRLAGTYLVPK